MDLYGKFNLWTTLARILWRIAKIKSFFHSAGCCMSPCIIWSYLLTASNSVYWNVTLLMKRINRLREKHPKRKRIQILAESIGVDVDTFASEVDQFPEINASRIVSLNSRINSGTYQPNPDKVSEKLLSLELRLKWRPTEIFKGFMHLLFQKLKNTSI